VAHPLAAVLERAASGAFPPADGATDVLGPDADGTLAVVCFTGHAFVLADVDSDDVARLQRDDAGGGLGGALAPELLLWLAGSADHVGSIDVVMAARGTGCGALGLTRRDDQLHHPRARRAAHHRRDVEIHGDDDGIVIVASEGPGAGVARSLTYDEIDRARTVFEWEAQPKPGKSRGSTKNPAGSKKKADNDEKRVSA